MNIAFLFPGQGSQAVGMGKDLYEHYSLAKDIFEQANEALGFDRNPWGQVRMNLTPTRNG